MIGKFNFFDIYGYFPGLVLLTLQAIPFGLVTGQWPGGGQLITALLGIPLAYVVGHLLRTLKILFEEVDGGRFPSDSLLDLNPSGDANEGFSEDFKERLRSQIRARFGLVVEFDEQGHIVPGQQAFLLCRSLLVSGKAVSYAEQFEGMYALMQGFPSAFLLSAAHYLGWVLAAFRYDSAVLKSWLLIGSLLCAIVLVWKSPNTKPAFYALLVALLSSGYLLADSHPPDRTLGSWFFAMALSSALFAQLCFGAFRHFAWQFAKTIYLDFSSYVSTHSETAEIEGAGLK